MDITTEINNYKFVFSELMQDVETAYAKLSESDNQYNRRVYVRTLFALVEGELFNKKQLALKMFLLGRVSFTESELAIIKEEQYYLNNLGNAETRNLFLRLPENLRFTFDSYARAFTCKFKLDVKCSGWDAFLNAVKIRNRITHPKQQMNLEINDKDLYVIKTASKWYRDISIKLMESIHNS
jgi:hypothetical protein